MVADIWDEYFLLCVNISIHGVNKNTHGVTHMIVKLSKNKEIEFSGRDLLSFLNSSWYFATELKLLYFHVLKNSYSEEGLEVV